MPTNQITQTQENVDSLRLLQNILEANRLTNPDITFQLLRQGIAERQQQASRQTLSKLLSGEITPAEAALTGNIPAGSLLAHQRAGSRSSGRSGGGRGGGDAFDQILTRLAAQAASGDLSEEDVANTIIAFGGSTKDIDNTIDTARKIQKNENDIVRNAERLNQKVEQGDVSGAEAELVTLRKKIKGLADESGFSSLRYLGESRLIPGITGELISAIVGLDEKGIRELYENISGNDAAKEIIKTFAPELKTEFKKKEDFEDNTSKLQAIKDRELRPSLLEAAGFAPTVLPGLFADYITTGSSLIRNNIPDMSLPGINLPSNLNLPGPVIDASVLNNIRRPVQFPTDGVGPIRGEGPDFPIANFPRTPAAITPGAKASLSKLINVHPTTAAELSPLDIFLLRNNNEISPQDTLRARR